MEIFVKAAHTYVRPYYPREIIRRSIVNCADDLGTEIVVRALRELEMPKTEGSDDVLTLRDVFEEMDEREKGLLETCFSNARRRKTIRRSVSLRVLPTCTIGDLKAFVKREPWIPPENLILVHCKKRPLEDDNSSLLDCGVKDRDTLLTCMGGSFELIIDSLDTGEEFTIPISSCFETVGELKEKIYQKTGHPLMDQKLRHQSKSHPFAKASDGNPLVASGVVRPFSMNMIDIIELSLPRIKKL